MLAHGMMDTPDVEEAVLTDPAVEPSWEDFPLTLKLTPFGAFDLTSRLAVRSQCMIDYDMEETWGTSSGMIEVPVDQLRAVSLGKQTQDNRSSHRWMLWRNRRKLEVGLT